MLAAVDGEGGAGDEAALVGDQEQYAAGDLGRLAETADRHFGDDLLEHVRRHGADHVGVDVTGCDGIDGDALGGTFLGERLGEAVDAGFGRRVVDLTVLAGLTVDRADVDNPAEAALAHTVDHVAAHVEARRQVCRNDVVPLLEGHAMQHAVAGDAGVVDDDLDRTQFRFDLGKTFLAGFEVADIPLESGDAGTLGEFAGLLVVAGVDGGDLVAGILQPNRDGFADTTRTTGNNCNSCHWFLPH